MGVGNNCRSAGSSEKLIALAGNPNVGKSTIFNALTGLHQHTGNWPGKTVSAAEGEFATAKFSYTLADIPGTYSLLAHSKEEAVARDFICFGRENENVAPPDATIVVCDATCLQRSLNLALQVMELCPRTLVCVNLMDEAARRNIKIDLANLEKELGVPVVGTSVRDKKSLKRLTQRLDELCELPEPPVPRKLRYIAPIERALSIAEPLIKERLAETGSTLPARWLALRLIDEDASFRSEIERRLGEDFFTDEIQAVTYTAREYLREHDITAETLKDRIVSCILLNGEEVCDEAVRDFGDSTVSKADRILTSKLLGYPVMLLMLTVIFWLTISGANYPSQLLSTALFWLGDRLDEFMDFLNAPEWLSGILVDGAYRVLAWVVAVMLPPMAIFFPLFTILEDLGYLPRVAYNLDRPFCKCNACGKQSLTMCMGFGCNAAGIVGCRIIDSKRERLIAMLTNVFVPCNGRLPILLTLISLFFVGAERMGFVSGLLSAVLLTAFIVLGVLMTFLVSKILSLTILKGEPSSFTLELPPFRKPQFGKILVRSLLDRTVFVLGRAAAVSAPAGAVIWLLANVCIGGGTLLSYITDFLNPLGAILGMDGAILTAFILGIPANEIVLPLVAMNYMQQGGLSEMQSAQMFELFVQNGWTAVTALCVIVFTLMHFPCATSLLTIRKEAGGKWAALAFVIPTLCGMVLCALIAGAARLFGF
ncbi:MAG: ferrous iron transport protein B [Oscillospiraceae bacterium]